MEKGKFKDSANSGIMGKDEFKKIGSMNYLPLTSENVPFEFFDGKKKKQKFTKG
jgi:hypothetical protein